jgi:hypothetical protein
LLKIPITLVMVAEEERFELSMEVASHTQLTPGVFNTVKMF